MIDSVLRTNVGHRWIAVALARLMTLQVYLIALFALLFLAGASKGLLGGLFAFIGTFQLVFIVSCISLLSINFDRLYKKEKQS